MGIGTFLTNPGGKRQRAPVVRSTFSPARVRERTASVVAVHRDTETPERPLFVLIPAGIVALGAFVAMIFASVKTWYLHDVATSTGVWGLVITGVAFIGAIFAFNYAWELYDLRKAVRRTLVMCAIAFAAVAVVASVLAILSGDSDTDFKMPSLKSDEAAPAAAAAARSSEHVSRGAGSRGGGDGSWTSRRIDLDIDFGHDDEGDTSTPSEGETIPYQTQQAREALRRKKGEQPGRP